MKAKYLLMLLLLPYLALAQKRSAPSHKSAAVSPNLVDSNFGFRGIRLESPLAAHPEMQRVSAENSSANLVAYERPGDNMKVGSAMLSAIQYFYYKGRLQSIILRVAGDTNRHFLVEALKTKYGKPSSPQGDEDSAPHVWKGTLAIVFIGSVDEDDESTVLIVSNKLRAQEKRDAASDL